MTTNDIRTILQQVEENTKSEYIQITARPSKKRLDLTASKFGGFPYWPHKKAKSYPRTSKGFPLTMLAQINMADLPKNDIFPAEGMLQFYILNSENTNEYAVVFHKTIDSPIVFTCYGPVLPTSFMADTITLNTQEGKRTVGNIFWDGRGFPIKGEFALEFSKAYESANLTENCFEDEFRKAAEQLHIQIPDITDSVEYIVPLSDTERDDIFDRYWTGDGHKLLGRPYFIQGDYRGKNSDDVLLLQIDSTESDTDTTDMQNNIVIGDSGNLAFFINKDELHRLDFTHVYYTWACC